MSLARTDRRGHDQPIARLGGYTEWPIHPALERVAECAWTYNDPSTGAGPESPVRHRVIPYTGASLCFESIRDSDGRCRGGIVGVLGPLDGIRIFEPDRSVHLEAIRLKAEWAHHLLGRPIADLWNEVIPWSDCGSERLASALQRTRSPKEAVEILEREIASRLEDRHPHGSAYLASSALDRLRVDGSAGALARLASSWGISERHLRRLVRERTGISPKRFQRVERMNRAVAEADRHAHLSWSALALRHGFCDQAHLVREISALTGATPTRLHAERRTQAQPTTAAFGSSTR